MQYRSKLVIEYLRFCDFENLQDSKRNRGRRISIDSTLESYGITRFQRDKIAIYVIEF
jgi:hypothetical protein